MQRVATELYASLRTQPGIALSAVILRSSWKWTHVRAVPYMVRVLFALYRATRKRDVDVVLFSSMVTASLALLFKRRLRAAGIRTATIVHGRDVTLPVTLYQRLVRRVLAALDMIMPISQAVQAECLARGATKLQMRRVPNGIDLSRYSGRLSRETAREQLISLIGAQNLPNDPLILCSVGRQVRRKGFAWFVRNVMPHLPERVIYVLAGDGPEADVIASAALRARVSHRVFLLGRVNEHHLAAVYRGSDVFIMPNVPVPGDMEGFGVVMLEAGANGLPTVASALEGITDVIEPGISGHLVEPLSPQGFIDAIMTYVDVSEEREAAAARTLTHVHEVFAWDAIAARYVETLALLVPGFERPSGMGVSASSPSQVPARAAA